MLVNKIIDHKFAMDKKFSGNHKPRNLGKGGKLSNYNSMESYIKSSVLKRNLPNNSFLSKIAICQVILIFLENNLVSSCSAYLSFDL